MKRGAGGGAGWVLVTAVVLGVTALGSVLAVRVPPLAGEPTPLTSGIAWQLLLPPAIVVAVTAAW